MAPVVAEIRPVGGEGDVVETELRHRARAIHAGQVGEIDVDPRWRRATRSPWHGPARRGLGPAAGPTGDPPSPPPRPRCRRGASLKDRPGTRCLAWTRSAARRPLLPSCRTCGTRCRTWRAPSSRSSRPRRTGPRRPSVPAARWRSSLIAPRSAYGSADIHSPQPAVQPRTRSLGVMSSVAATSCQSRCGPPELVLALAAGPGSAPQAVPAVSVLVEAPLIHHATDAIGTGEHVDIVRSLVMPRAEAREKARARIVQRARDPPRGAVRRSRPRATRRMPRP